MPQISGAHIMCLDKQTPSRVHFFHSLTLSLHPYPHPFPATVRSEAGVKFDMKTTINCSGLRWIIEEL